MSGRTRLIGRAVAIAVVLATSAAGLAQAGVSQQAQHAQPAGPGSSVEDFGACLAAQNGGDLLLLLDESGSLADTDPADARITAARYLLERLAAFTGRAGVDLDIAVAGFSGDFDLATDWTALTPQTLPAVTAGVQDFADRESGFETDYWSALEGARRALADRAPGDGATRCQAVAWFSDGRLDIPARDEPRERDRYGTTKPFAPGVEIVTPEASAQATALAADSICRGGGLADQIRSSGVVVFAIGLAAGDTPAGDFDLMRSIATGEPGSAGPCGDIVEPRPGEFQLASDLDGLLFAFDAVATPGSPPRTTDRGICQTPGQCAEQEHRFVLDDSISAVHVLGVVDADGIDAEITTPTGQVLPLSDRTVGRDIDVDVDGVAVTYSWLSGRTVEIDLIDPGAVPAWPGVWSLTFVDPRSASPAGVSRSSVQITGDLEPAWTNAGDVTLASGDRVPGVELAIVDATGTPVDLTGTDGQIALSATLRPGDGAEIPVVTGVGPADLVAPVELDLTDVPQGPATLRLVLSVTTAPGTTADGTVVPGTRLDDAVVDVDVQITPPLGFPAVADRVDFGTAEGVTALTSTLTVTGPGCVWLPAGAGPALTGVPDGAGQIEITAPAATSADTCVRVAEGATGELALRLDTEEVGNGTLAGSIPVVVAPLDQPDRARTVDVEVTADLRKPLNVSNFLLVLIVALLLGPGIPLLLMYLSKRATATIPPLGLAARRVPVTVDHGRRVLRGGAPFAIDDADLVHLVPLREGGTRRVTVDGVELRSRTGWSPFGAAVVTASVPGGPVVLAASGEDPSFRASGREALLPLAVHNRWVVLQDAGAPPDTASVLLLVGADADTQARLRLVDDIASRLPSVLWRVREAAAADGLVTAPPPAGPHNPFGGVPVGAPAGANPFDPGGRPGVPFAGGGSADGPTAAQPAPSQSWPPPGGAPPPGGPPPGAPRSPFDFS